MSNEIKDSTLAGNFTPRHLLIVDQEASPPSNYSTGVYPRSSSNNQRCDLTEDLDSSTPEQLGDNDNDDWLDLVEKFCDKNDHQNVNDCDGIDKLKVHEPNEDDSRLSHVLEIYDFPSKLKTRDLLTSLSVFKLRDFDIIWVDDTHALTVFSSQVAAKEAMSITYNNIRLRPLSEAIKESRIKAQECAGDLLPYKPRPQTSIKLAHRLVTAALGIRTNISSEQRAVEKRRLQEAKANRRLAKKLKQDVRNEV